MFTATAESLCTPLTRAHRVVAITTEASGFRRECAGGTMRARFAVRSPLAALAGLLACIGGIGCGDGPICRSEVLVLIQSPGGPIAVDDDPAAPGVQTEVRVQSTLPAGAT